VLDHLSIQCADVSLSSEFYDGVLAPLGGERVIDFGSVIGYGTEGRPTFWLGPLVDGASNREVHIAFNAPGRDAVRGFFEAARRAGAEILHEPRVWPEYHPDYYGVFVRDPDGNNVEAVSHTPPET
jgi:catechol 2,3-dioxygenase-like lactoylglutathione lyase family enzyme